MLYLCIVIGVLAGYFLGNLNGSVSVSAMMNDDVRAHGSGNAGLTNFIRNYGATKAVYVIAVDAGKALIACLVTGFLLEPYGLYTQGLMIGGTAVMLGHVFPVLLGFRGGKGILSGLFIALIADWRVGLLIFAVFAVAYLITRYVSLGSVLAAATFSVSFCVFHWGDVTVMACAVFMGALTIFMHRGNIVRLLKGQERKTNLFSKGKQV